MKEKRPRMVRTPPQVFSPTERDYDVLTLVGLCRYLSTEQVARDCFPSPDRARRRLRRLFDAGLLDVRLTTSTAPNLLSLTRRGLELLSLQFPDVAPRLRLSGAIRVAEVDAHLAAVDARLYAAAWGAAHAAPLVRWAQGYGALPEHLALRGELAPAAVGEFAGPTRFVAVEVAVTPEALRRLDGTLEQYALAPSLGVWVVVCDCSVPAAQRAAESGAVVLDVPHLVVRPVRPLPEVAGRRAEGPAAPESSSAQAPAETRRFYTEGRR